MKIAALGRPVPWKRSPTEMWNFEIVVPEGAASLDVTFDYLASASAYTSATAKLAWINWWSLLLYPRGPEANDRMYRASLTLPQGWKFGTALPALATQDRGEIAFAPASLVTLIDSPVLAGEYFRTIDLAPGDRVGHFLDIAGDSPGSIQIGSEDIARYRRLVAEARALFGPGHYRSYHLLLSLTDQVPSTGLEHHESSDNRAAERALLDESARRVLGTLLSHEYVHSWNGKYRTPVGLVSGVSDDYQVPVDSELLWVYEGLTEYYGEVLGARSGLRSPELSREALALFVSRMDRQAGRQWRPLVDTATAAQLLYYGRPEWASWRRGVDFYSEGALVWLDADVLIRQKSGGRKSLDDFVRAFHGGPGGAPAVKTYTAQDVYAGLNAVVPHDWAAFFRERVYEVAPQAPRSGIENAGWKLAYREEKPALVAASEEETEAYDFWDSLGIVVHGDGTDGPGDDRGRRPRNAGGGLRRRAGHEARRGRGPPLQDRASPRCAAARAPERRAHRASGRKRGDVPDLSDRLPRRREVPLAGTGAVATGPPVGDRAAARARARRTVEPQPPLSGAGDWSMIASLLPGT